MAAPLQLRSQFRVVVDFAVEGDDRVAILRNDGLIAAVEVDDLQPRGAQRNGLRFKDALLVGPAMNDRLNGAPDTSGARMEFEISESGDSAQAINVAYRL